MSNGFLSDDILPTTKHFFVLCEAAGVLLLSKDETHSDKRKQKPKNKRRWRNYVNQLSNAVKEQSIDVAVQLLQERSMPGIRYTTSITEAESISEEIGRAHFLGAIAAENVTDETTFIGLYRH